MEPILGQLNGFLQKFGTSTYDPSIYAMYDEVLAGLQELGLSAKEARILVYLIIRKQSTATDISRYNDIGRTETYNYITGLMRKGVVFSTFDRPQKYYALPLEKALDHLIETRRGALQRLAESKADYCSMLERLSRSMSLSSIEEKESYQILSGENSIISTVKRVILDAHEEIMLLVSEKTFASFYHTGIVDDLTALTKRGISVHLQTSCKNIQDYIGTNLEGSNIVVNSGIEEKMVDFVLIDNKDIVVMLLGASKSDKIKPHGFYTNNLPIISVFKTFFENTK
ncbi:putative transcriptional regulator [Candidatus Nitrososphaera evergladensis SR1]|jgi:sugar-specific transcriptional regulator TrmB|uniref:Putative transcriptional regulator n=1 Tax=Candidatus Nitrososphaera evergladensis SR1 TaxID=1459636 RepID=A0A075MTI4_9ARCH|nr:helix-turn-helix domain-containing protein [Candidatus Nitrososphaera evergladensis]AIF84418.1 putative transcriptional regulator [Candidatus Nitrososphaera evergladensis SR1]